MPGYYLAVPLGRRILRAEALIKLALMGARPYRGRVSVLLTRGIETQSGAPNALKI